MEEEMRNSPLNPLGQKGSVQLMLSTYDMDTFQKRQEQEAILDLRKRAIARWLKQLPMPEESEDARRKKTMWTSFQSFGDEEDDSVREMQREQRKGSRDVVDDTEETPIDMFEKKSMPSENDCPIQNLRSMKRGGQDRQLHRSLSNTTAFRGIHRPPERQRPSQFTRKWNVAEERADMAAPFLEVEEQPLKTIEDVLTCPCPRSGDKGETSGSDGWSALSDDPEDHKEDTAYGGSSFGSRKKGSDEHFHRKYKPSSPTFSPPVSQCIEPHTTTEMRPCTPTDPTAAECTSQPVQDSEDWWRPNLFKGFMGMICNAGWIEEEVASSLDGEKEEDEEDSIAMHDRVLRRLVHRKMTAHIQRPSPPRLPARARLHLRMQQAKRFQDAKSEEIHCALEHPFDIKEMIPNGTESPHPLAPPEIRVIEYLPPTSVTDLSDFECYMGPVLSAFVNGGSYPHHQHPLVGHCQNWLLEKLLCFLGGRPAQS